MSDASPHTAALPKAVPCPFCGSRDSSPLATFGSLLMTAHYYCNSCHTTFDWVRQESDEQPARTT